MEVVRLEDKSPGFKPITLQVKFQSLDDIQKLRDTLSYVSHSFCLFNELDNYLIERQYKV